jgi:hypothetical protein
MLALLGEVPARSADTARPATIPPVSLRVHPARILLNGPDAVQQLAVERLVRPAAPQDVTGQTRFDTADPAIATVDQTGLVSAKGDGETTVTVRAHGLNASIPVKVGAFRAGLAISFNNQVVPIFTNLGCNSGGCHGKASGQNGFRLSLLGFEPSVDYETIVHEGRGRRVFPSAPDSSLLLKKATAQFPHGGGRKLDVGSHEYRLIRRWIESGMPSSKPTDPQVQSVSIYPEARALAGGSTQQLIVTAHYSDGRSEDVSRWTQYQSNDADVAAVSSIGRVEAHRRTGQAAIMARYQGQVAVFRAIVPSESTPSQKWNFPTENPVDAALAAHWKSLGIAPSDLCTDAEFHRRASLDITGSLPAPADLQAFIADPSPDKRQKLINRLLEKPEYASFFALKWADVLRNKRDGKPALQHATYGFYDWIRESLEHNVPYDQFVRAILVASGSSSTAPPVQWYKTLKDPRAFVDDTAQVFLGMRLQCARCHHHPFERWSQSDYYAFAAFFGRVARKPDAAAKRTGRDGEIIFTARTGTVAHPKTGTVMAPRGLGGPEVSIPVGEDPRQKLVDWMADASNPYFARAVVNRYWAHFFGRGIVEPLDDFRSTNPATNPELLDTLATGFVASGYDLKALIRTICSSRAYGLSSLPNESNAKDRQSFARHYPRRMSAEVLLDAIAEVSAQDSAFDGLPAGTRAIELPDEGIASSFLDAFGRPKRDTPCECERSSDPSLSQSLMLLNSSEVQGKLAAAGSRVDRLAADVRPDREKVSELFWSAFGRPAAERELTAALAHIASRPSQRKAAYEDIIWALLNSKEFQFID